jgi:hypothetical protein
MDGQGGKRTAFPGDFEENPTQEERCMVQERLVALPAQPVLTKNHPLWLASWANPYRKMEWIHRYVFAALTRAAAERKIEIWMRRRSAPLPSELEMRRRRLVLRELPEYPLDFWEITWLEDDEQHTLVLFGACERQEARARGEEWVGERRETWEQLEMLRPLSLEERMQFPTQTCDKKQFMAAQKSITWPIA